MNYLSILSRRKASNAVNSKILKFLETLFLKIFLVKVQFDPGTMQQSRFEISYRLTQYVLVTN